MPSFQKLSKSSGEMQEANRGGKKSLSFPVQDLQGVKQN